MTKLIKKKRESQPSGIKTCGSTFKNPENNKAWQIIKKSGCDKMQIGDKKNLITTNDHQCE